MHLQDRAVAGFRKVGTASLLVKMPYYARIGRSVNVDSLGKTRYSIPLIFAIRGLMSLCNWLVDANQTDIYTLYAIQELTVKHGEPDTSDVTARRFCPPNRQLGP